MHTFVESTNNSAPCGELRMLENFINVLSSNRHKLITYPTEYMSIIEVCMYICTSVASHIVLIIGER